MIHQDLPKRIVVFSPHLDDAVLSMGNLLFDLSRKGALVEVISVFTVGAKNVHSDLNTRLLQDANVDNADTYFTARKEEDKIALDLLGHIPFRHLGFTDAAWRVDKNGKPLYESKVLNIYREEDNDLFLRLIEAFSDLQIGTDTIVFAPVACGKHIDHVLVRNSCSQLFTNSMYYKDFPYSSRYGLDEEFIKEHNLEPQVRKIDKKGKEKAVRAYTSQIQGLFHGDMGELPEEIFYVSNSVEDTILA
jgi:LmbE family N-acetylglucosaminyl deacetylase